MSFSKPIEWLEADVGTCRRSQTPAAVFEGDATSLLTTPVRAATSIFTSIWMGAPETTTVHRPPPVRRDQRDQHLLCGIGELPGRKQGHRVPAATSVE